MSRRSKKKVIREQAAATQPAASHDRWTLFGVAIFLAAIMLIVFGQTLHFQFINFDDGEYI